MSPLTFLFLLSLNVLHINSRLSSQETIGLKHLYSSLNGNNWSVCKWNITQLATNKTLPHSYCGLLIEQHSSNSTNDSVYAIDFSFDNNLNGTISDHIDMLNDLNIIKIWSQKLLFGTIPHSICNLPSLTSIDFYNINLHGNIPQCIANMTFITKLQLIQIPLLSFDHNTFKSLCLHSQNISFIQLGTINYNGAIPKHIGNHLKYLNTFSLWNLPNLNSTLPLSFSNITQIQWLEFGHLPGLHGTLPVTVLQQQLNELTFLHITNTSLHGALNMNNLCGNTHLSQLQITDNPLLSLYIPNCIQSLTTMNLLAIAGSDLIYGTVPTGLCNLKHLYSLKISDTSIAGTLPQCVMNNLTNLNYVDLHSNNLNGDFPSISLPQLKLLDIHNNLFSGSVSFIFSGLEKYQNLEIIALHSNKFYDKNIAVFFEKIFKHSKYLKAITLYDQQYVGGRFGEFTASDEIYLNNLSILAIQKLDIGGTLPNNAYFG
eukprot:130653_1